MPVAAGGSGVREPAEPDPDSAVVSAQQLWTRCRQGDWSAWRSLYETHHGFVYRTARKLGLPDEEAEEVTHEVFMALYEQHAHLEVDRLTTWLYRVAANRTASRHRRRKVRMAFERVAAVFGLPWSSPPITPEQSSLKDDASRRVEKVLARMSPKKRQVLVLFELDELSGKEIAERVGCSENTVWTRLHHGRREFLRIARQLDLLEERE